MNPSLPVPDPDRRTDPGRIFSLSAVGCFLIFGVLGVVNLAHGVFIIGGAYLGLWLKKTLGLDPLAAIPVVFAMLFVIGAALQRTLVATAIQRGSLMTSLLDHVRGEPDPA